MRLKGFRGSRNVEDRRRMRGGKADGLSGVWAREVGALLEPGDLEEALPAARQIGDDTLQRNAGKTPQPHTFTHDTSAQRQRWFARGYETGDPNSCATFDARQL